ncbi:hypothetical protein GCM10009530_48160 [Microbispora corallina]|uniref:Putative zinc-finger domain-containing protein n=1 Tax=Microbispora corallina TaxID=83302 RepID=A0ABQ4G5M7_9ACTN|nr:zf-HC2 domain-containing protein [Microbispora corallina]GIH42391.1 hypothetical protein Mco01_53910 [Microbispora corallina]
MTCDEVRISLGVYVLGALDADEAAEVEAHLDGCPACQAELAELSGLPPLLSRVSADEIAHASAPPHAVLDRLLAASARRNRRSRVLLSLAASVVVAALGGTAWLAAAQGDREAVTASGSVASSVPSATPAPAADSRIMDAPADSSAVAPKAKLLQQGPVLVGRNGDMRLEIRLTPEAGGTRVAAEVYGVPEGTVCTLRAVDRGGAVTPVASWSVGPATYGTERTTTFEGSTALQATEISRFVLGTPDGRTLVTVRV